MILGIQAVHIHNSYSYSFLLIEDKLEGKKEIKLIYIKIKGKH